MTSVHERRGALEAVERVVSRGGDSAVADTLAVLRRLYPTVELRGSTFAAAGLDADDDEVLARAGILVSHFTSRDRHGAVADP